MSLDVPESFGPEPNIFSKSGGKIIEYNPTDGPILKIALTSPEFESLVDQGIHQLGKRKTESGIQVITDGNELIYFPLSTGTRLANDRSELAYMGRAAHTISAVTESLSDDWVVYMNESNQFNKYRALVDIHFHPIPYSFSGQDIDIWERGNLRPDLFKQDENYLFGVFIPKFDGKGKNIGLTLFGLASRPTDTSYQQEDMDRASLQTQIRVMRESGVKLVVADLPVNKGKVNLAPLRHQLTA